MYIRVFNFDTNSVEYTVEIQNYMQAIPDDGKPYGLRNGVVVCLEKDTEYIQQQLNYYKNIAVDQVVKSYDYAVKYGVFKLDETYYANMAWENTWSKVINLYNKVPSLPTTFSTRLYIKNDNKYYNTNIPNNSQGLDNLLLLLQKQQFMTYQPLRDSYINELKLYVLNNNLEGIKSIIELTKNNGGFGDTINEQEESIEYA